MSRLANFFGYDTPAEMFGDAVVNIFIASAEEAGRSLADKMFGGSSDSGPSLFDKKERAKIPSVTNDGKSSTSERPQNSNATHASPYEHTVKGHGQHYNTKEGRIWKEKEPFTRGKKDETM